MAILKQKKNGQITELKIPACSVQTLDMDGHYSSNNLEDVLTELGEGENVYLSDEEPDKDGIWISSDNTTTAQENPTLVALKKYIDDKLGTAELTTEDKTIKGAINEHETQLNEKTNPNLLINGDFQVWQRGTSFDFPNGYTADRWFINKGKIEKTMLNYKDALKITRTSDNTTETNVNYKLEGLQKMRGRTYTLSWKSSVNVNLDYTYLIYSASGSDTVVISSGTKTYNADTLNSHSITFTIPIDLDMKYQVLTLRILRQCSIGDHNITISDVKLEQGTVATPFVSRSFGEELALCQRYYEKSYGYGSYPVEGQADFTNVVIVSQSELEDKNISFRVEKRVNPTLKVYSPNTGKEGKVASWIKNGSEGSQYYDITYRGHYVGTKMMAIQSFNVDSPITGTVTSARLHWIADAEIY